MSAPEQTSGENDVDYLLSLQAVRDRSKLVLKAAIEGTLHSFTYHPDRMSSVSQFVIDIISRDFGPDRFNEIPPHGRWQHFNAGGFARVSPLLEKWTFEGHDEMERTRRVVDLFFSSVLVDAGVGDVWKFREPGLDEPLGRSEGTAVASLYLFLSGFASSAGKGASVDGKGLASLTEEAFNRVFQVSPENPMVGALSRVKLLNSVGNSLLRLPEIFGPDGRPGNLVDYLIEASDKPKTLDYALMWSTLQKVLIPSWPKDRTHINGKPIGDAWPLQVLADIAKKEGRSDAASAIQPFHKLTQWLGYSLVVPFVRILDFEVVNVELGTGLPEYRNGGLFVDLGVLELKDEVLKQGQEASGQRLPRYSATGDTIVEWRALTVALLDELHRIISKHFAEKGVPFSIAQMLEAGTWKGGRELAAKLRPETMSSPILIEGDGTLF